METQGKHTADVPARPANPLRVLLADDVELVRRALRLGLGAQAGLAVVGDAADGNQTLELAASLSPDAVLLDLGMPGPEARDVIAALKALRPAPAVLVLSGRQDPEAARLATQAGADDCLQKDRTPAELAQAIRKACAALPR